MTELNRDSKKISGCQRFRRRVEEDEEVKHRKLRG